VPEPSISEVEVAMKKYKSPGAEHTAAEMIQEGRLLRSEIHNLKVIGNKELPHS
jgi:hypothetical protein